MIDVGTGDVTAGATIVLQGGDIVSIGTGAPPSGTEIEIIDIEGAYVLPCLVDAHTHLDDLEQAERALRSGVTTVRGASVGSYRDVVIGEMTEAGILVVSRNPLEDIRAVQDVIVVVSNWRVGLNRLPFAKN